MWTRFPELDKVLAGFVAGVRGVLGDELVGIYLQGSFAVGGADEHSDVDFIAVTRSPLKPNEQAELQAVQERVYAMPSPWAQHLEGSYITADLLRRLDPTCTPLFYFDNGATEPAWDDHCNTAVVRWSLREHGIALVGPEPRRLVDPVSAHDLRAEMGVTLEKWDEYLGDRSLVGWSRRFQSYLALSMCRILHTMEAGRVGSKDEAESGRSKRCRKSGMT